METVITSLAIVVWSSFKYLVGLTLAVYSNVGLLPSYFTNIGGGLIGVLLFTYFGSYVQEWFKQNYFFDKPIFSWKSRMLVNLRKRMGLAGVAFITPVVLSIPIGIVVALSLTDDKRKIVAMMLASCIFWSSVVILPYYLFGFDIQAAIKGLFH